MAAGPALHAERWLRDQTHIITEIFTRATEELQTAGVRVLTGSHIPIADISDREARVQLIPLRFSNEAGNAALALSISASSHGGPPRYIVTLEAHGRRAVEALRTLSLCNGDCWQKFYVGSGLWLGDCEGMCLLNDISKIGESTREWLTLSAVFLQSDLGRSIQTGLMVLGVLYRATLDAFTGVNKLRNLTAQLDECLNGHSPRFQRTVRP